MDFHSDSNNFDTVILKIVDQNFKVNDWENQLVDVFIVENFLIIVVDGNDIVVEKSTNKVVNENNFYHVANRVVVFYVEKMEENVLIDIEDENFNLRINVYEIVMGYLDVEENENKVIEDNRISEEIAVQENWKIIKKIANSLKVESIVIKDLRKIVSVIYFHIKVENQVKNRNIALEIYFIKVVEDFLQIKAIDEETVLLHKIQVHDVIWVEEVLRIRI